MIKEAVKILASGKDINAAMMGGVMEEIMQGKALTAEISSFLAALSAKGETVEELVAAVTVMRLYATKINTCCQTLLDTCGTGGDTKGTFNISTAVAFAASGAGVAVAKHGNRSVSSCCGSADVLEALGVNINMPAEQIEECLEGIGIAFLFAQNLHPAMKYAQAARKQIGKRTMFNVLGPLTNPAGAMHQLIGVFDKHWTAILAEALRNLGSRHVLVVHGADGLDEITTTDKTFISEVKQDKVSNYEISPEDFGISRVRLTDLEGGDISCNAEIILDILNGKKGSRREIVLLNTAASLYAADKVSSIKEGILLAEESIDSKKALTKLEQLKQYSQR